MNLCVGPIWKYNFLHMKNNECSYMSSTAKKNESHLLRAIPLKMLNRSAASASAQSFTTEKQNRQLGKEQRSRQP